MGLILLLVFGGGLFGAMLLMLFFGYQSIEEERARSAEQPTSEDVLVQPRFFATLSPPERVQPAVGATEHATNYDAYVDAVARALERHIRRESAATSEFVTEPSVERLYGRSGPPLSIVLRHHAGGDESRAHRAD